MTNPEQAAEAHYDRLDDQGQLNGAEIQEISGFTAGDAADFTVEAMFARHPEWAFREVTDTEGEAALESTTAEPVPAPHFTDGMHYGANRARWIKVGNAERIPELKAEIRPFGDRPPKAS